MTGEYYLDKVEKSEKVFNVVNITEFGFIANTSQNDIALLTLKSKVVMGRYREAACLPVVEDHFKVKKKNSKNDVDVCIALGWGKGFGSGENVRREYP